MNFGNEPVFDNRELAMLIWLGFGVVWAATLSGARSSMWAIVQVLCSPKVAVPLGCLFLYVAAVVAALSRVGVWTPELASETLFWFVGTACVLFVSLDRMSQDPRFFRRTAVGVLSVTVLFEFVSNLYTFSLAVELVLVPTLFTLGALLAVSQLKPEFHQLRGCLQGFVTTAGLGLLAYSVIKAIRDPARFATATNAREFAVPVVMTLCLLPFLYILAVYANYDSLLSSLRLQLGGEPGLFSYARLRLLRTAGIRLRAVVRAQRAPWRLLLPRPTTNTEIDRALGHIKARQLPALATAVSADERIQEIVTAQAPGWEYQLFAARLEAGATAAAMSSSAFDGEGRAFARPLASQGKVLKRLQEDREQAIELVGKIENVFERERVEQAFGAPGSPGNAKSILGLAEDLIVTYSEMLAWSMRTKATKTNERFAELVRIHSELLDQPNDQIDAYVDRWNEVADQLPDLVAEAESEPGTIDLDMSLVLTVDDGVLARFSAEAERLRSS